MTRIGLVTAVSLLAGLGCGAAATCSAERAGAGDVDGRPSQRSVEQVAAAGPKADQPSERAAAQPAAPSPPGPRVVLSTQWGEHAVTVEVASTWEARERGLMYRRHLAQDRGMLFVFEEDAVQSFWMKNTFISLDMIFIDAHRRVVGVVAGATPHSLDPRTVGRPSRYVVEVNAGWCKANGVAAGAEVRFEGLDF